MQVEAICTIKYRVEPLALTLVALAIIKQPKAVVTIHKSSRSRSAFLKKLRTKLAI